VSKSGYKTKDQPTKPLPETICIRASEVRRPTISKYISSSVFLKFHCLRIKFKSNFFVTDSSHVFTVTFPRLYLYTIVEKIECTPSRSLTTCAWTSSPSVPLQPILTFKTRQFHGLHHLTDPSVAPVLPYIPPVSNNRRIKRDLEDSDANEKENASVNKRSKAKENKALDRDTKLFTTC
jgi:hypothetical protein